MTEGACFQSKVDGWIASLIVLAVAASASAIWAVARGGTVQGATAVLLIGLPGIVLPMWVRTRTRYPLTDDALLVSSGPFHWRVLLRDIRTIEPSRSGLSAPALSLDRVRIDDGAGRSVLISPKERKRFVEALSNAMALNRASTP